MLLRVWTADSVLIYEYNDEGKSFRMEGKEKTGPFDRSKRNNGDPKLEETLKWAHKAGAPVTLIYIREKEYIGILSNGKTIYVDGGKIVTE